MDNLHLIQLGAYERPEITEERNREWVGFGKDNDYYQTLIDAYMNSTTNNAVINGVVDVIYGKGLDATDSSRKPDMYAQMKGILKPDDLRRTCQDLKLLGEGAMQVTYSGNQISSITHFPRETLRAEKCNEEGKIENYFYSADWSKVRNNTKLKKFPVFGSGAKNEIYIIRRYVAGFYYYSPADYQISYAVLEEEIADYLINDCQSGFSGTKIVNFNNGVPDREKQLSIKNEVMSKLTGSYGEKVIVAFNANAESKTTVDDIPLNDAPDHYSYLSEECARKLLVTHRITSPLLVGLRDGNSSLGSNADEIKNASLLFHNVVIKPYQNLMVEALDAMFAVNNISLNLYFKTLEPLEFMDLDAIVTEEQREEETGVKVEDETTKIEELSADYKLKQEELTDEEYSKVLEVLKGEVIDDEEWDMVDVRDYEADGSEEAWADSLIEVNLSDKIEDRPSGFSILDKSYYKIRFKYVRGSYKKQKYESRKFCKEMMERTRRKEVYRIEDIDKASRDMNFKEAELPMHKKQKYDLFKFKGGVYCRHKWVQVLYRLKVSALNKGKEGSKDIKDYKVVKEIPKSYRRKPSGTKQAIKPPVNMPENGHYPGYKKK